MTQLLADQKSKFLMRLCHGTRFRLKICDDNLSVCMVLVDGFCNNLKTNYILCEGVNKLFILKLLFSSFASIVEQE